MPWSSVAIAATTVFPDTVAPFAGSVSVTVGAEALLRTVTRTTSEVPLMPDAFVLCAASQCVPLVARRVSHAKTYGGAPRRGSSGSPSSRN